METSLKINKLYPDFRSIARVLTIVENDLNGASSLLKALKIDNNVPVIGITGPPGAGKSTLVNELIKCFLADKNKIAVLAVDPTSPFNFGSLLGDRIRMRSHFNDPAVFIRSVASRGSLGGITSKTIEMTDVLKASGFDYIIIETVGVGQSEVEIAGLADITLVVLVPESGDEIQNIKSGVAEIASAFIVNKADRPDADIFANNLKKITELAKGVLIPVIKTNALTGEGIKQAVDFIKSKPLGNNKLSGHLLTEKAYKLIQEKKMAGINKNKLHVDLISARLHSDFNFYDFVAKYAY